MKKTAKHIIPIASCLLMLNVFCITAQTSFYNSDFGFSISTTDALISSFTVDEHQIYFNANNYMLYVFDKNNTNLKFEKSLRFKSNNSPHLIHDKILVGTYNDDGRKTLVLNKNTGLTEQTLNLPPSSTSPFQIDNILYGTFIGYDGGEISAYDLKNNKVLWSKFISHGVFEQPIYGNNYITLSIGDNNWTAVNYDGTLSDTVCNDRTYLDSGEAFFVRNYNYLTHDNFELSRAILEDNFQFNLDFDGSKVKIKSCTTNTALLTSQMLLVFKDGRKLKIKLDLQESISLPDEGENEYFEILELKENGIWFIYENVVVHYDFKKNKIIKTYDVSHWNPHQAKLDYNNLWLISKNDGQLYGLQLEETKESLDRKTAIEKKEKELEFTKPDPKRVEAEKAAKEKLKSKTKYL